MDDQIRSSEKMLSYLLGLVEMPFVPTNSYRIQLNPKFPFKEACKMIPYLKELGIDALYTSPYFQATPGSMHGYDISSPLRLNPELGSYRDYEEFCRTLKKNDIGHIADLVANHMSASEHNEWWWDVLENGKSSLYNAYFDIDWNPIQKELHNRVLLPLLPKTFDQAVLDGTITISLTQGVFTVHLEHHFFPMNPSSYPELLTIDDDQLTHLLHDDYRSINQYRAITELFSNLPSPRDREEVDRYKRRMIADQAKRALVEVLRHAKPLHEFLQSRLQWLNTDIHNLDRINLLKRILNKQHYRLTHWQEGPQNINYRRFFDINDLAALKVEDIEVFKHFHTLLFRLVVQGHIQGLRIDHPDGFFEPATYLEWLQKFYLENLLEKNFSEKPPEGLDYYACKSFLWNKEFKHKTPIYVVVEKILEEHESLPSDWDIHGTVGYKFLNTLNGLFIDTTKEKAFTKFYESFTSRIDQPEMLLYEQKKSYALHYMLSEINVLTKRLYENAVKFEGGVAFSEEQLKAAICELFAAFPVYRTYVRVLDSSLRQQDRVALERAFEKARKMAPQIAEDLFQFLQKVFVIDDQLPGDQASSAYRQFILRFQQLSPPIRAKGFEDTFLYIYNRFISLNEVGGNPMRFGISSDEFHTHNQKRLERWPKAFIATSTHDTKRSEDLRARLNVLSEMPERWQEKVCQWEMFNRKHKFSTNAGFTPDSNTEYLFYQSLLGYWPIHAPQNTLEENLLNRIKDYMRKACREAKVHTNWMNPDFFWEENLMHFIEKVFSYEKSTKFWDDFRSFHEEVAFFGILNSFSALTLKFGSPGVLDTYQGMEFLDFSFVDPDNRRFVDFQQRMQFLDELKKAHNNAQAANLFQFFFKNQAFNKMKFYLQWLGLNLRKQHADLFLTGEYLPIEVSGRFNRKLVAFMRKKRERMILFFAGRFFTDWGIDRLTLDIDRTKFQDTTIHIPRELWNKSAVDILSGKKIRFAQKLTPKEIFSFLFQSIYIVEEMGKNDE